MGLSHCNEPPWAEMGFRNLLPSPHLVVVCCGRCTWVCTQIPLPTPVQPHRDLHFTPINPDMHPLKHSFHPTAPFLSLLLQRSKGRNAVMGVRGGGKGRFPALKAGPGG